MKRQILIIDESSAFVKIATHSLVSAGYLVEHVANGEAGRDLVNRRPWDLVIVHWSIPGLSGEKLIRQLRSNLTAPLFIIADASPMAERVLGLRAGGDDFLSKSIEMEELLARVEAHLRRGRPSVALPVGWLDTSKPDVLFGDLVLSFREGQLHRHGSPVQLSHQEFRLLCLLADHPYEVLSIDRILSEAWGYEAMVTSRTVYVHVAWLRKKLGNSPHPEGFVATVRGLGYVFRP